MMQGLTAFEMCSSCGLHYRSSWLLFGDCSSGNIQWSANWQRLQSTTHITLHAQSSCTCALYSPKQDPQVIADIWVVELLYS